MTFQDLWSEFFTGSYKFGSGETRKIEGNVAIIKTVFENIPDSIIVEDRSQFLLTDSIFSGGQSDSIKSTAQGIVLLRNCFTNIKINEYIVKLDNIDSGQSFAHVQQTSFSSSSLINEEVIYCGALYIKVQRAHTDNCNVTEILAKNYVGIKIDETKYGSTHHHNVFNNNTAKNEGITSIEEGGGIIHDSVFTNNNAGNGIFCAIGTKVNIIQNCVFNRNEAKGNLVLVITVATCYVVNCYVQTFNDANKDRTPYYISNVQSIPQISTNFAHDNDCSVRLIVKEVLCRTENKSGLKITSIVLFSCFCLGEHNKSDSNLRSELRYQIRGKE